MKKFTKFLSTLLVVAILSLTICGCSANRLNSYWQVRQNIPANYEYERMEFVVLYNKFDSTTIKEIWINAETANYKYVDLTFIFDSNESSLKPYDISPSSQNKIDFRFNKQDVKNAKGGWLCVAKDQSISRHYVRIGLDHKIKIYEVVFVLEDGSLTEPSFIGQYVWTSLTNSKYCKKSDLDQLKYKHTGADLIDEQAKFPVQTNEK